MTRRSKGRGTAAAFGLLLLLAGLVGGGVLYAMSQRRPTQTVEAFARAPVGCTTTLQFTETGVFFVFEDVGPPVEIPDGDCEPAADPSSPFAFEISGPDGPVVPRADASLSYEAGDYIGASVASIEIEAAGEYEIVVVGDDPSAVAAVGRDPDDGVDELRRRGIMAAAIGGGLGALLLVLAGVRSKKAAEYVTPDGPGWSSRHFDKDDVLAADTTRVAQHPVNPHAPAEQVSIAPGLDEIDDLLAQAESPEPVPPASPWAPPTAADAQAVPAPPADPASGSPSEPDAPPPEADADPFGDQEPEED